MAIARPRSQTLIISVVCVIAIAIVLLMTKNGIASPQNSDQNIVNSRVDIGTATNTNPISNNDDWKKSFITDTVTTGKSQASTTSVLDAPEETMTGIFGKNTLISYMALKQTGMNADPDSIDAAGQTVISSAINSKTPTFYVIDDLNITTRSGVDALAAFNVEIANTFSLYTAKQNETTIASQSIEKKDPELLKKISPIIKNYEQIIDNLRKMQTPSVLSMDMLKLINGFSVMKFNAESLQMIHSDPLRGLLGINNYQDGIRQIMDAIISLRANIESRGGKLIFDGNFINVMLSIS
ncbi:MAG: hypothetical protein WCK03_01125 [Candidatus Taylorbacteria bacterium]